MALSEFLKTKGEIYSKYIKKCKELDNEFINDRYNLLKQYNLDGLVVRKSDKQVGWLIPDNSRNYKFYPRKKDGNRSKHSEGYVWDASEEYEKYTKN